MVNLGFDVELPEGVRWLINRQRDYQILCEACCGLRHWHEIFYFAWGLEAFACHDYRYFYTAREAYRLWSIAYIEERCSRAGWQFEMDGP